MVNFVCNIYSNLPVIILSSGLWDIVSCLLSLWW